MTGRSALAGPVLFFTPEGGLEPHFAAQCLVARTLKERGHDVLFARCDRVFTGCPVHDSHGLTYPADPGRREEVCRRCREGADRMLREYGLEGVELEPLMAAGVAETVDKLIAAAPDDMAGFHHEDLPFGRVALADTILATRVCERTSIDGRVRGTWLRHLRNALTSYELVKRIGRDIGASRLLVFNNYALFVGARLAARSLGIPSLNLTLGGVVDRRRYILLHKNSESYVYLGWKNWPRWRDLALDEDRIAYSTGDLLKILRGVYTRSFARGRSAERTGVHERLGLDPGRRLLVAYTSSLDEMMSMQLCSDGMGDSFSLPAPPFPDQAEWIAALAKHVAARDDLQLVVRVHPREGTGTFEGREGTQHLARLRERFGALPPRVHFVWPRDPVSTYDLGEAADAVLVSWSSVGMEMARLGVPVLATTTGIGGFPQDDFVEWSPTPEGYFQKLEEILARKPELPTLLRAYRAHHLFNIALDLGDVVPHYEYPGLPPFRLPREATAIEEIIVGGREPVEIQYERLSALQGPDTVGAEPEILKRHLRLLVRFLLTGTYRPEDFTLVHAAWDGSPESWIERLGSAPLLRGVEVLLERTDRTAVYLDAEGATERFSPMALRLAAVSAQLRDSGLPGELPGLRAALAESAAPKAPGSPATPGTRPLRILLAVSYYEEYLRSFYRNRPGLSRASFREQSAALEADHFAWPAGLARHMRGEEGFEAEVVVTNAESLQRAWAAENGAGDYPWNAWREEILAERVRRFRPDVLWIFPFDLLGEGFLRRVRPYAGKILMWMGSPLHERIEARGIAALLTENPATLSAMHSEFGKVVVTTPGFGAAEILSALGRVEKKHAITFAGGLSPLHRRRAALIAWLLEQGFDIRLHGYAVADPGDPEYTRALERIRGVLRPPLFGLDYYRFLAESSVTLDFHGDCAAGNAGNYRLFEATGMGACVLTEEAPNLGTLFEPGAEVLTFRDREDLASTLEGLLAAPEKARRIAAAGQARTLSAHDFRAMVRKIRTAWEG